ncbi:MAG: hypothetical protein PHZ26_05050 [Candidatus Gracilibacteria bacterium]|nr:hypothetical protein [Candidatus Gracilibacteria bacterium]MDD2909085.1 hypothetical protein [Candidatus Gracilibacteria bacterium]
MGETVESNKGHSTKPKSIITFEQAKADGKIDSQELANLEKSYEMEKNDIKEDAKMSLDKLKVFLDFSKKISANPIFKNLDNLDKILGEIASTSQENQKKIYSIFSNAKTLKKDQLDKFIGDLESDSIEEIIEKNPGLLIKLDVDKKTVDVDKKTVDVDKKTVDVDKKTVDVDKKTVDVLSLLEKGKFSSVYEKYFAGVKDGTPEEQNAKKQEILKNNIDNIFADIVTLIKESKNPEEFKSAQNEAKNLLVKLSDSGLISQDKVAGFINEINSIKPSDKTIKNPRDNSSSQVENMGLNLDPTKKENGKYITLPDAFGIKQEIKVERNGDVKRSLVSPDGNYSREVPIFLPQDTFESKINGVKTDIIVNKDKQSKLEELVKRNPDLSEEDKQKVQNLKNGLESEQKELNSKLKILESNNTIGQDKEKIQNKLIENNTKLIEFLSNTGITAFGKNFVDKMLVEFELNFDRINPGKKGDFGLEKGFGIAEKELLVKGLQKITGLNFNPENGLMSDLSGKTSKEVILSKFSDEPKIIDNGVLRLQGVRDRLSKQAN